MHEVHDIPRANLLPGRVHVHHLHPLLVREIGSAFALDRALAHGTLPGIYGELDAAVRSADLRSYVDTYLREEAQRLWLARWKGQPPPSLDEEAALPWREAFAVSHRALEEYLAPLGDADFDRVVEYKNTRGEPFALPLGQLVTHLVNHGTAHRAELGLLLERIGRSPGDLDYFLYFRRLPSGA